MKTRWQIETAAIRKRINKNYTSTTFPLFEVGDVLCVIMTNPGYTGVIFKFNTNENGVITWRGLVDPSVKELTDKILAVRLPGTISLRGFAIVRMTGPKFEDQSIPYVYWVNEEE